jgi:hypothetical protein
MQGCPSSHCVLGVGSLSPCIESAYCRFFAITSHLYAAVSCAHSKRIDPSCSFSPWLTLHT